MVISCNGHDFRHSTAASNAIDVDDDVNGQGDRFTCALVWKPDVGRQDAVRQAHECLLGGVRMDRAERALMAGVQRLEQVERLRTADFTHEDAIGAVPERRAQQVGNGHCGERSLLPKAA